MNVAITICKLMCVCVCAFVCLKIIFYKLAECWICFHGLHNTFPHLRLWIDNFINSLPCRSRSLHPWSIFVVVHWCKIQPIVKNKKKAQPFNNTECAWQSFQSMAFTITRWCKLLPAQHSHEGKNHILWSKTQYQTVEWLQRWRLVMMAEFCYILQDSFVKQ